MTATYNFSIRMMIRLSSLLSLIFFVLILDVGCTQKRNGKINIVWNGKQATGISVPKSLLDNDSDESILTRIQIRLEKSDVAMLGEYQDSDDHILFSPLIPLSPGRRYEVVFKENMIGQISVPSLDENDAPALLAIYPSADTLPENLLKIYLQFSAPMREGEALQHINLLNQNGDTIPGIFLDLQPELWNKQRTALTVWLDPGRIKRDLIPNQQLGNPLKKGELYTLRIDNDWRDAQGLTLKKSFTKSFVVDKRDSDVPQPDRWIIDPPAVGTIKPLRIHFDEPLDYFLLLETIQIRSEKGALADVDIRTINKERGLELHPKNLWKMGSYRLKIASYLEDLAGNNLNRPFDRDTKLQQKREDDFVKRKFTIR